MPVMGKEVLLELHKLHWGSGPLLSVIPSSKAISLEISSNAEVSIREREKKMDLEFGFSHKVNEIHKLIF